MCYSSSNNATGGASPQPVPPGALAVAVILIAIGVCVVLMYGFRVKREWKPEQTYVFDVDDEADINKSCAQSVLQTPTIDSLPGGSDGVEGLDDTLETHLLAPEHAVPSSSTTPQKEQ